VLRAIEWILLGSASVIAIITGVAWHRPGRVGPWLLLAGAIASLAVGDVFYALDERDAADVLYLVMFAMVALSLLQLTRGGAVLVDRARLIDLLAFTCSALLVVWVFVIGTSGQLGAISAADVIGDLLLLGVAGRLIKATGRNWSAILLATGAAGMLFGDIVYPLHPGTLTETGFVVLYLCWGAAALHPSMSQLTRPTPTRPRPWDGRWAALLGLSVATPPVVLLIEALSGPVRDGVVIAVAAGITLMLTITRLSDSIAQHSQALARERGLRVASAALVAAADVPEVDEAVRAAIAQLMPAQAVDKLVFATDDREVTLESLPPADAGPHPRSWWVDGQTEDGPAATATLVCPLWLEPLAVARPNGGALVLTGRRDYLTVTRDSIEVLAGQAALALDRICLVEAVGRRDSDLYLRAVIRNTAEIMLVIDEDQRIRYASPALRTLIGNDELPPLTTLHDLVHPDDRPQVREAFQSEGDGVVFCALQRADESQVLVEATYRDLRADRLVQGFVVTLRDISKGRSDVQMPRIEHLDELPAWVNRRSAQHKFRY
jgi:PAS domain S-box-containing protein